MNQVDEILFAEYLANVEFERKNDVDACADYFSSRDN